MKKQNKTKNRSLLPSQVYLMLLASPEFTKLNGNFPHADSVAGTAQNDATLKVTGELPAFFLLTFQRNWKFLA